MNTKMLDTTAIQSFDDAPSVPVVGIGASAGGLEAFVRLLAHLPATLKRRIARRMALQQQNSLSVYRTYLRDHPAEVDALYQDLLIGVTGFFRDPAIYQRLLNDALPRLLAAKPAQDLF